MGKHSRHLRIQDHIQLYEYLLLDKSIAEIASDLRFYKAIIYRELEYNSSRQDYRPDFSWIVSSTVSSDFCLVLRSLCNVSR